MKIRPRGFTIVELLVVIVVIATLAAVVIFGYGAWRNQLATDVIKSDLTNAATAMESARNFGSGYPADIPSSYTASENSTIRYVMGDEGQFCLEGRSKVVSGIYYFIDSSKGSKPLEGTCAGGEGATPDWTIFVYDTTMPSCTSLTMHLPITSPTSAPGSEIDWGDGSTGTLTSSVQSHTYTTPGEKIVQYKGPITTVNALSIPSASRQCFKEIRQWSDSVTPTTVTFKGANNVQRVAEPPKSVTDMSEMFWSARTFNQNISSWDVSHVTDMKYMFFDARAFNQNINSWDVSNVTDMSYMFNGTLAFNQPLDSWDVSKVTNIYGMFANTGAFNQPLNSWNTSNVTNMGGVFTFSDSFNQPLNAWNTSKVTDMGAMFAGSVFNQPIGSWNTSNVSSMGSMFNGATSFNQNLSAWNISSITSRPPASFDLNASSWTLPRPVW